MHISIRMIGIATTVFWIFLIGFAASAAYSVKDLQFSFGNPTTTMTPDNNLVLSIPITILNRGYYDIDHFRISTEISDAQNTLVVANGSTDIPIIPRNQLVTSTHNATLEVDSLISQDENLLFNDSELNIKAAVGMRLAELIPVEASSNFSIPWGAPLHSFTVGQPLFSPFNLTHVQVSVPVIFENHAFFDLEGRIRLRIYNSANSVLGRGDTVLNVPSGSSFQQNLNLILSSSGITPNGQLKISFNTSVFDYGPLVIPYG